MAKSVDTDQQAPRRAVRSGSPLFAIKSATSECNLWHYFMVVPFSLSFRVYTVKFLGV